MKKLLLSIIALVFSSAFAEAQQYVQQSGGVTSSHAASWATSGVLQDAGTSNLPGISTLGIISDNQTPFCINSALPPNPFYQFCLGVQDSTAAWISFNGYGGAAPLGINCNINGTITTNCLPGGGSSSNGRTRLNGTVNYYYSSSGSSANPCTLLSPCDSPQTVSNLIQETIDLNCHNVFINQIGSGTFNGIKVFGPYVGDCGGDVEFIGAPSFTITNATNATPIVITTSTAHGYSNGQHVLVSGVIGNQAANGAFVAANVTTNTFQLTSEFNGSNIVGNGTYSSGGTVASPATAVLSGTGNNEAVSAQDYAQFFISGYSLTSAVVQGMDAINYGKIIATMMDFGNTGNTQLYCTRRSYIELDGSFSISGSPAAGQFGQASHGGECRKQGEGYFRVSQTFAAFSQFVLADWGDWVETNTLVPPAAISGATNASPIVITTATPHGLTTGDVAMVLGVTGNTAANGAQTVTVTDATHFRENGTTGNGAFAGGGTVFGQGMTWNFQGFTEPGSANVQQYQCSQNSNCQTIGQYPPPQGYFSGNIPGNVGVASFLGPNITFSEGSYLGLFGDPNDGICWFHYTTALATAEDGCFTPAGTIQLFSSSLQNGLATFNSGVMSLTPQAVQRACVTGVNFNSANTDNAIPIAFTSALRYEVAQATISNPSASLTTATLSMWSGTGGSGNQIFADTPITVNNSTVSLQVFAISQGTTDARVFNPLYARVGTAEGSAATGDVCVLLYMLP